jgi:hypothetical protein
VPPPICAPAQAQTCPAPAASNNLATNGNERQQIGNITNNLQCHFLVVNAAAPHTLGIAPHYFIRTWVAWWLLQLLLLPAVLLPQRIRQTKQQQAQLLSDLPCSSPSYHLSRAAGPLLHQNPAGQHSMCYICVSTWHFEKQ